MVESSLYVYFYRVKQREHCQPRAVQGHPLTYYAPYILHLVRASAFAKCVANSYTATLLRVKAFNTAKQAKLLRPNLLIKRQKEGFEHRTCLAIIKCGRHNKCIK